MTTHKILITSLYGGVSGGKLRYYYSEKDDKVSYCDALLSAEASCKYVLAHHVIDEIVTFGSKSTFDEGDGLKSLLLKEGSSFYASGVKDMSTYSLLRYRLAEYLDEVNVEEQDIQELLNDDEKAKVNAFVEKFFYSEDNSDKTTRYNRFFDHLMQDANLRDSFINGLKEAVPEAKADPSRFITWTFEKLYGEMKSSAKLELLEANEGVKIRFIPVAKDDEEGTFIENFTKIMNEIIAEGKNKIELYICVQSDDASDTFVLINLMNLIKAMPDANISVAKVITTTKNPEDAVAVISDDTFKFGISDLVSGTRAFLQYGKTDMLLDFWHKSGLENPEIEKLLYAMRNIDYGISLCDVTDIMRGIKSLRDVLKAVEEFKGETFVERFFEMIVSGIKQDYGSLVESDEIVFIDLVKWAYKKGFWQQTLTLIESRAPEDIVDKGFFYYSNSPANTQEVLKVFAQIYYDFKPFEKYKLDDISHYYVKFFGRGRVPHIDDSKAYQMAYANSRIEELTTDDPNTVKAHTLCPDQEALRDMLFSYYYIGDVRNATNHASEEFSGFSSVMHDSDVSERMSTIVKSIEYFIHCYENVIDLVEKAGNKPDVDKIDHNELVSYSKKLKPRFYNDHRNNDRRNDDRRNDNNQNNNGQNDNGQGNGQNNNGQNQNNGQNNNGQGNNQNNNGNGQNQNNGQNNQHHGRNNYWRHHGNRNHNDNRNQDQNQNNVQNNNGQGNNQNNNGQNNSDQVVWRSNE